MAQTQAPMVGAVRKYGWRSSLDARPKHTVNERDMRFEIAQAELEMDDELYWEQAYAEANLFYEIHWYEATQEDLVGVRGVALISC